MCVYHVYIYIYIYIHDIPLYHIYIYIYYTICSISPLMKNHQFLVLGGVREAGVRELRKLLEKIARKARHA